MNRTNTHSQMSSDLNFFKLEIFKAKLQFWSWNRINLFDWSRLALVRGNGGRWIVHRSSLILLISGDSRRSTPRFFKFLLDFLWISLGFSTNFVRIRFDSTGRGRASLANKFLKWKGNRIANQKFWFKLKILQSSFYFLSWSVWSRWVTDDRVWIRNFWIETF